MTRKPGSPADDDQETPGGRAAERRREHLAARFGEDEDGAEPDEEAGSDEEAEPDPLPGDPVDRP